ncbi:hypothetical protein FHG64_04070 [Antarcticibacterium flavum]|uniref:DUF1574 domain-containing protein n=1 Tax=Antarcticibacterium flavum TaxID=2058175 RepID=A0A5B7WZK6_9FLAO|nr:MULTISPECIES: hypothetical protein [Antarcticibacterium]MCM4158786.1 hypothetical protein [Antarcticibacterium sp. W02-3]QCY68636.1 hypothetical protein FHG64_04070 [Antarcticibacterium flavum]
MKKFITNSAMFLVCAVITIIIVFWQADGKTDPFYLRFTTHKQSSLILGTSRAAQGILPDDMNKKLNRNDIYNYSFTLAHSPYGPTYLKGIKDKLDTETRNGIFVITVDPWSIASRTNTQNDSLNLREDDFSLGNVTFKNYHPNFEYLIKSYDAPFLNILRADSNEMILHKNGWLEVNVDMDSTNVATRSFEKMRSYKNDYLPHYYVSEYRYNYLSKTISYLKKHGDVYLVRLPVSPEMFEIENILLSDFDNQIKNLSRKHRIPFYNMTKMNEEFQYTDGNHLYKESGGEVSILIAEFILKSKH